ncbi:MAG: hypothetical protein ABSA30_00015 [Candidatus Aminicenantales bacterium]|jgi:hypothetical protein
MHLAALHGVKPREPIDYMHFLRQAKPPEKPLADAEIERVWNNLCAAMAQQKDNNRG